MLKVFIVISDNKHPVYSTVNEWALKQETAAITLVNSVSELTEKGDFLFLVSCSELVKLNVREKFNHTLVLHASDLPNGRGWSPHIWQILKGANVISLSFLEAEDNVDSGRIWLKKKIILNGTELFDEINHKLFNAEIELINEAITNYKNIKPSKQSTELGSTYYRKRTPEDSQIDINKSIASQMNLLRVCDNDRFPAYFEINGQKYAIKLEKVQFNDEK